MTTPIKTLYVWGDGAVWKLGKGAMAKVAAGADWIDVGRELKKAKENWRTGRWINLPKSLYWYEGMRGPESAVNGVAAMSYEWEDEILAVCREATAAARKSKLRNPTHPAGPGCFQWGSQKVYCGPGAEAKADRQGRAILATGWRERNPSDQYPITPDYMPSRGDMLYVCRDGELEGRFVLVTDQGTTPRGYDRWRALSLSGKPYSVQLSHRVTSPRNRALDIVMVEMGRTFYGDWTSFYTSGNFIPQDKSWNQWASKVGRPRVYEE